MPDPEPTTPPAAVRWQTLTFLFTDLEGSTRRWEEDPPAMAADLAQHDHLVREAVVRNGGTVFKTVGDAFCAVFASAPGALLAALEAQRGLAAADWGGRPPLSMRAAINTGDAEVREGDYYGPALNRVARLLTAGHGGQTLLTAAAVEVIASELPDGVTLMELGQHRLRDLQRPELVYQMATEGLRRDFPPLRTLESAPGNLPVQLTTFIGREAELARVAEELGRSRLVTITGAGGAGKSRLALQVAANVSERFDHGAWLVELAPLTDPALLVGAVVAALRVPDQPGRSESDTLDEYVRTRSLLLVLDNCEHLLEAVVGLVDHLLRTSPGLRVLATSREALGTGGEVTYRIPSLALPRGDETDPAAALASEAVRLFVDRARSVLPAYELLPDDVPEVVQVVRRLDGIALAIELAAARMRHLAVEQIAQRLDDRFRLLTGGSRAALPRQQTLRALIDWSHDLLSEPERVLFRRASAFIGGLSLASAEEVAGFEPLHGDDVIDLLAGLADKSLLTIDEGHEEHRYRLLETIRQYARDRLLDSGEAAAVREAHARHFLDLATRAEAQLKGPYQLRWLDRVGADHANLLAAADWLLEQGSDDGLTLLDSLFWYWLKRSRWAEGADLLVTALERLPEAADRPRARTMLGAAALLGRLGRVDEAMAMQRSAAPLLDRLDDPELSAAAAFWATWGSWYGGDVAAMEGSARRAFELYEGMGDGWGVASARLAMGLSLWSSGDPVTAVTWLDQAVADLRRVGDLWGLAFASALRFGISSYVDGRDMSDVAGREALELMRRLGDRGGVGNVLAGLAWAASYREDWDEARQRAAEMIDVFSTLPAADDLAGARLLAGTVELRAGNLPLARAMLRDSEAQFRASGNRRALGDALGIVGELELASGDLAQAASTHRESLGLRVELGDRRGISISLVRLAQVRSAEGRHEEALRLLGASDAINATLRLWLAPPDQAAAEEVRHRGTGALGESAAAEALAAGREETTGTIVATALAAGSD